MALFFILLAITALFFLFLILKTVIKKEFCVLCVAVVISWLGLFALYFYGKFNDLLVLGILIGESVLGLFYVVEKNVRKEFTLFRLPFLLSLIFLVYSAVTFMKSSNEILKSVLFLTGLWGVFLLVYFYRANNSMRVFVNKIVECCKKW